MTKAEAKKEIEELISVYTEMIQNEPHSWMSDIFKIRIEALRIALEALK